MKTKNKFWLFPFIVWVLVFTFSNSCSKDDEPGIVKDIDGNVYHTVTIGSQVWMVENLKTTKYLNGDAIPYVVLDNEWLDLEIGGYCDYNNKTNNSEIYGRLYNWYAVNDSRNIAPKGWHIPSDKEWTQLSTFLGGYEEAEGKLKEKGFAHWKEPNTGATNETGFTALPGGGFFLDEFDQLGENGRWWSSTEFEMVKYTAIPRNLYFDERGLGDIHVDMDYFFSVRCIKD